MPRATAKRMTLMTSRCIPLLPLVALKTIHPDPWNGRVIIALCHSVNQPAGGYQKGIRRVSGGYQEGIRRVSGGYQEGIRRVSGGYQEGIRRVSGGNDDGQARRASHCVTPHSTTMWGDTV
jgi:hypothetical protein